MKKLLTSVVVLGLVACSDSPNPLSPDLPEGPNLSAAASRTPFTATATNFTTVFGAPPIAPGNTLKFRDDVVTGDLSGDLGVGTVSFAGDTDFAGGSIKGPFRGPITFSVGGGDTFEGRFIAINDFSSGLQSFTGHFQAAGTGGLAGQEMQGRFTNMPGFSATLTFTGDIVDPMP